MKILATRSEMVILIVMIFVGVFFFVYSNGNAVLAGIGGILFVAPVGYAAIVSLLRQDYYKETRR